MLGRRCLTLGIEDRLNMDTVADKIFEPELGKSGGAPAQTVSRALNLLAVGEYRDAAKRSANIEA